MSGLAAWWARAWPALLGVAVVATVAAPAAVASYLHARHVVGRHDEVMAPWLPLSVDGMLLAALVVMWVRRRRGVPVGRGPWAAFGFGIAVTIAANAAAVEVPSVEAFAVNLFPPVALAVALELVALVAGRTATSGTAPGDGTTPSTGGISSSDPSATPPATPGDGVGDGGAELADAWASGLLDEHGTSRAWATATPAATPPPTSGDNRASGVGDDRALQLIGEGAGRRRLARELGIPESRARTMLAAHAAGNTHAELVR